MNLLINIKGKSKTIKHCSIRSCSLLSIAIKKLNAEAIEKKTTRNVCIQFDDAIWLSEYKPQVKVANQKLKTLLWHSPKNDTFWLSTTDAEGREIVTVSSNVKWYKDTVRGWRAVRLPLPPFHITDTNKASKD